MDIPWLLRELDTAVSRQDQMSARSEGKSAETPSPVNWRAADVLCTLRTSLHGWARCLAEDTDTCISGDAHEWLARHVASLRMREWSPDALLELVGPRGERGFAGSVIGQVWVVIDRAPERVFAGQCACGSWLWAHPGMADARCRTCGAVVDVEDARDALLTRVAQMWLTAAQAAAALTTPAQPVTPAMIRKLKFLKRVPSQTNDRGQATYRVSDIQDALRGTRRRAAS